jgi:glycosyltransferase involved in cell wall biosynthesis
MKKSVLMIAPFNTRSGYGDHARSIYYSIMDREDLDIKCIDVKWGNTPRNHLRPEVPRHKKLLDTFINQDQIQGQPDILIDIRIPNEFATGAKVNIGITAGVETDVVSPEFLQGMNRMNLNIVPSRFTAETFNRCTFDKMEDLPNGQKQKVGEIKNEKPIQVLFEGVDTSVYYPKQKHELEKDLSDELNNLITEDYAYLHVGQWGKGGFGEDRKNIGTLIKSFLKAFANVPNPPGLVLKTNGPNFSTLDREDTKKKIQSVKDKFGGVNLPNIYLIHGDFTIEEMSTLYNHPKIGVFITCTHGEGYGRPMAEATCCDLPVIATKWSGHMDFLTDSESMLIDGFMKEVPKSALWPPIIIEPSKWFNVNEADVVRKIRTFHKKRKLIQKKAIRLGKKNRREKSLEAMSIQFNKILDEVLQSVPQPVSLKLPKLKKVGDKDESQKSTKINLPKLKRVT